MWAFFALLTLWSYSLRGDRRGWLKIDPVTGEIFSAAPLDREAESLYRVKVVATEVGEQTKK